MERTEFEKVRASVKEQCGNRVEIRLDRGRNKVDIQTGVIKEAYPSVFTIEVDGEKNTPDQLLSFKSDLSDKEVGDIVQEINHSFEKEEFSSVFSRIEALVREYPSSYSLILSLSLIFEFKCTIKDIPDRDK